MRIPIDDGQGTVVYLRPEEIVVLEADGDDTIIHSLADQPLRSRRTLGQLERRLPPAVFFRSHRHLVVNLEHVRKLVRKPSGDHVLELDNAVTPLARRRLAAFRRQMEPLAPTTEQGRGPGAEPPHRPGEGAFAASDGKRGSGAATARVHARRARAAKRGGGAAAATAVLPPELTKCSGRDAGRGARPPRGGRRARGPG